VSRSFVSLSSSSSEGKRWLALRPYLAWLLSYEFGGVYVECIGEFTEGTHARLRLLAAKTCAGPGAVPDIGFVVQHGEMGTPGFGRLLDEC
jgi:hypothetical protein